MPIQYQDSQLPTSFASCSVWSQQEGDLPEKLKAIHKAGFDGIELSMPDILDYGKLLNGSKPDERDYDAIADVASRVKELTDNLGLEILMLQPFPHFEGWRRGMQEREREDAFERARGWMRVMETAGTDMLQIGSSDAEGISDSFDDMAQDLAELADIFAEKHFRIAYENWCWATRAPNWNHVWEIIHRANRPNLGLCLDTFQSAGGEFADPTTPSGLIQPSTRAELASKWHQSLKDLSETIPADKIFVLQISDAYHMDPPMSNTLERGQPPRARWSRDYRPLPCDGGYLPVTDFLHAVLGTGFRGWLSVEVFDSLQNRESTQPVEYTEAAMEALHGLLKRDGTKVGYSM